MSKELDVDFIKSKLEEMLKIAHTDHRKWKVKVHQDRFQYSCPICGDSVKSPGSKLRGTLYFKNLMHICFNEIGCNMSFTKLLSTFNIALDSQRKLDIYDYVDSNIKYTSSDATFVLQRLDKLINLDELTEFLNNTPETQFSNFSPIKHHSAVYQYLKFDRLIENFDNIYEAEYAITSKWREKVLVNLNKSGNKVLGIQIRNLKSGDKRLFKVFNFEKLYNMMHPNNPLDELEAKSYNKYSNFYNLLNINWEKPVTIFEGYLDSLFFPNSIGAIGLNSIDDMNFLLDGDENIKFRFFFDQDNIGVRKSLTMLERGNQVFLWQKLMQDVIRNKRDFEEAKKYFYKIKDLNKLVQEMKNPDAVNKLNLEKYFSVDSYDKQYLDYTLYPDNRKNFAKNKQITN